MRKQKDFALERQRAVTSHLNTGIDIILYDRMQNKRVTVPISMSPEVVKRIDGARAKLGYRSRNEVVRESIKHFLDEVGEMKIIKLREVPRGKAKKEILGYLQKKEVAYPSDIADELRLDYKLVVGIIHELWEEKKVEY